jgi:DNA invertase Pin-like site-specific DNA recombinase
MKALVAQGKFIAYYRVSTQKQGQSGLGLAAQRSAVENYLNGGRWTLLGEYTEVETGKGSNALDKRPQLRAALDLCKKRKATLVIAKLDRLARNVHFVSGLIESGVEFVAADMPQANKTMIQMHAVMSEWERDAISKRTKEALTAAKARGVKLGKAGRANLRKVNDRKHAYAQAHAEKHRAVILALRARGFTQRAIADELNKLGIKAPRGDKWHLATVQRVLARLAVEPQTASMNGRLMEPTPERRKRDEPTPKQIEESRARLKAREPEIIARLMFFGLRTGPSTEEIVDIASAYDYAKLPYPPELEDALDRV